MIKILCCVYNNLPKKYAFENAKPSSAETVLRATLGTGCFYFKVKVNKVQPGWDGSLLHQ